MECDEGILLQGAAQRLGGGGEEWTRSGELERVSIQLRCCLEGQQAWFALQPFQVQDLPLKNQSMLASFAEEELEC